MQRTVEKIFFALIRSKISGTELFDDVKNLITPEILPALFKLSKRHDLAHLIGDVLDKNGLLSAETEIKQRFLRERSIAIFRYGQIQYELEQICQVLENAEIKFLPLKGSVLRQSYPEPWLRTSCDIDILVEKAQLDVAKEIIKSGLSYEEKSGTDVSHDVSLFAPSGVHLELHYSLVEEGRARNASTILCNVWENIIQSSASQKLMTDEMFYFYHIAHMAKHFEIGGCGVRSFLDVYVLKMHTKYQSENCTVLLEKGGLLTFAKAVEQTARVWFNGEAETALSKEIQDYILYAGMYGDTENRVAVEQVKRGGKFKYVWSRIFLPYDQLKMQYPRLEKRKCLTPFYQVKRWCRVLFGKGSKNLSREWNANKQLQSDKKERVAKLLENLDL